MIFVGISRPNLNPTGCYYEKECTDGWFISADVGSLWGNGKYHSKKAPGYKQGDRVGMLLDLDNGSLRFFKNGVAHGPGYAAGSVAGPVVVGHFLGGVCVASIFFSAVYFSIFFSKSDV
jgi:hypothetical protein